MYRVPIAVAAPRDLERCAQDVSGAAFVARVREVRPQLAVMEGMGLRAARALGPASSGRAIVAVSPRQVRDLAKARGRLAKTDRIDAKILADFAERMTPEVRALPDEQAQELKPWFIAGSSILQMLVDPTGAPLPVVLDGLAHGDAFVASTAPSPDQRSAMSDQRSAISDQRSAISDQRSAISDQRSAIRLHESPRSPKRKTRGGLSGPSSRNRTGCAGRI